MKLLILLALAVAIGATVIRDSRSREDSRSSEEWHETLVPERIIRDFDFRSGREYKFVYNGQLATGIPGSSQQHSATRIQALVTLVFRSEQECLLKFVECRFGKLNDEMSKPREIMPFNMFEQLDIEPELYSKLQKPIKFTYRNGMIDNIEFDGAEQPWSANVKRGVLNLLQVNLNKEREIPTGPEHLRSEENRENKNFEFYTTMEKTLEGECETLYTLTSDPCSLDSRRRCRDVEQRVLNVTKSINFEKCIQRPEIRYNERFQQICPTCEQRYNGQEPRLRSSTVAKLNMICSSTDRTSCLIEHASIESQYHFVVFNEESNMITSYVNQTLELIKTSEIETRMEELHQPVRSDSQMIYTPDWDIRKENFFLEGEEEFQQKTPFSKVHNKVEFVKSILRKLVHYMRESVEEEAPRQFTRLVKVLRMLKKEELNEVHERFYKNTPEGFTREEYKKIKDLHVDAVALCGTHDCIEHLIESIKKHDVTPIKASFTIRKLMEVRVVNKKMVEKVMELCESTEMCQQHPSLKQAVYLTVGSMMRAMCGEHRDTWAVDFKTTEERLCPESFKEEFVQKIMNKFRSTESKYEKVLLLKTIGNAGLDVSIIELEKVIKNVDRQYTKTERIEAIMAMRHLVDRIPKKIVKVLMPLYLSRSESAQVRMVSLFQLMQSLPEKPVLDQITRSLNTERHRQVAAFTYTTLQSLANTTNPCQKRLAEDIKLSLRQGRYLPVGSWLKDSKFLRIVDLYCPVHKMGVSVDMAAVYSNFTSLPNTWVSTLNLHAAGMWSPRFVSVGFYQDGIDRMFNRIIRSHSHNMQSSLSDLLSGKFEQPSPKFNYRTELKDLFNKLNINEMEESETEPFGSLFLKFKNQDYGFLPVSKDIIPEELKELLLSSDINNIVKRAERLLKDVNMPFSFHTATFVHEQSRKIPTTLGLPLRLSMKIPTVMQVTGILKVDIDNESPLNKVKLSLTDVKPSIVATMITKIECWSPIVNTGVKVLAQAKVYTPFDLSLTVDAKKEPMEIKWSFMPTVTRREEVFSIQTRPVTFVIVWPKMLEQWQEPEEKTIHGSEWTRVRTHDVEFGEHEFGVKFNSRGNWHRVPEKKVSTTPFSLLAGPNKYTLTMEPGHEMPKEINVKITGKLFNYFEKKFVDVKFNNFFEDSSENFLSKESSEERTTDEFKVKREAYYKSYKGERPVNNEIKIDISTKGSSIKREVKIMTNIMCDEEMKSCKCKFELERTPVHTKETKPWKFIAEVEALYPTTPFLISELTSDKQFMCRITSKWGEVSNMEKSIDFKIVAEQSSTMQSLKDRSLYKRLYDNNEHRQNFRSLFSPVAQYEPTLKYGLLDEYKIDIDYKLSTYERQLVSKVYRMLKTYYYSQSYVRDVDVKNSDDRVQMKINIDPINRRYANITVVTPREECKLEDLPLPADFAPINMRQMSTPSRSIYHMISQWTDSDDLPVCEARTDRIKTFDDVEYNIPTSTCYSVLAKDCSNSERSKFAVLLKKETPSTEKKMLKIVTPTTKLIIRLTEDERMECELNGETKRCEEIDTEYEHNEHVVLRCRKSDSYLRCELPEAGIRVYFDGYSANLKVSGIYRSQVCGLCGQYDEDRTNEWMDEKRELVDRREMFESYLVKEGECNHEFNERETVLSYDFDDERYEDLPESVNGPVRSRSWEVRPIEVTKTIEQSHEICFSKQPVKKCPRDTYPVEYHENKDKIVYSCIPRNDVQAEIFQRRTVQDLVIPEVEQLTASFTETERVPKSCRQY